MYYIYYMMRKIGFPVMNIMEHYIMERKWVKLQQFASNIIAKFR